MENPSIRILLVDDDKTPTELLKELLTAEGYQIDTAGSGESAIGALKKNDYKIVITDLKMPGISGIDLLKYCVKTYPEIPVILLTAHGTIQSAVDALKIGAFNYLTKPVQIDELLIDIQKALEIQKLKLQHQFLQDELKKQDKFLYDSNNDKFNTILKTVHDLHGVNSTILLYGESGTGKEVIAKLIHKTSLRTNGNFVPINCGAIPENLIESELFGHVQGAFTDAKSNVKGKVEIADGGTLFLDEVNELSMKAQVALLRFLQEREIVPVGSERRVKVDVRIIVATNRDLLKLIKEGLFREDLYYRINVFPIQLPPLRKRKEDIIALANWFISEFQREYSRPFEMLTEEAQKELLNYHWPGNIRELRNCIERASILTKGKKIPKTSLLLPTNPDIQEPLDYEKKPNSCFEGLGIMELKTLENEYIHWVLAKMGNNKNLTASKLGISERGIRYKLKK
jgi:two-component system, NtrC family, response regulator AtoC